MHLRGVGRRLDTRVRAALARREAAAAGTAGQVGPTRRYPVERLIHVGGDPNAVWTALPGAVEDVDTVQLVGVDEAAREVRLTTGMSSVSMGQDVTVAVTESGDLRLRGWPRVPSWAVPFGERAHLGIVGRRLRRALATRSVADA